MRVHLTRKLAESVDGVDLSARRAGDTFDLPSREAELLIADATTTHPRLFSGASHFGAARHRSLARPSRSSAARKRSFRFAATSPYRRSSA